ncbi:MAG TPA: hypothetical protein VN682_05750 [Terriglobales bacterium]|nr:hypothetical protein [Terriglobales bacterium]HXF14411.1 hypothetical protein [Terriglobales bacterium]
MHPRTGGAKTSLSRLQSAVSSAISGNLARNSGPVSRIGKQFYYRHWDGINRKRLGQREHLGAATVERWF